MGESAFIVGCEEAVLSGKGISDADAGRLMGVPDSDLAELAESAGRITAAFHGPKVDVEQLNNIKKNACSEDCTFCAQSALYDTGVGSYQLPEPGEVVAAAQKAKDEGAESYCLVAAWRGPSDSDFERVCGIISEVRERVGIGIECSLGFLTEPQAKRLKGLGVRRYNHNLETARSKFAEICTTHTYDDRLATLTVARDAGLELCTGGIVGMGENRAQRLELALELARLRPEEVTINILVPVPGTPLELQPDIGEAEVARLFSVVRFLLPDATIKVSGGREAKLADSGEGLLRGGANGIITGGYLTMGGNAAKRDLDMIERIGLHA